MKSINFCRFFILSILILAYFDSAAQKLWKNEVLIFSYYNPAGEFELAYSSNVYDWTVLNTAHSLTKSKNASIKNPCIIKGRDKMFYMVGTSSEEQGIFFAFTKDFKNWSDGEILPLPGHELCMHDYKSPGIIFNEEERNYIIYWTSTICGTIKDTEKTDGYSVNRKIYHTSTYDFKNFTSIKPFYEPGFDVTDATIIKDEYGYTMLFNAKDDRVHKYLKVAFSDDLSVGFCDPQQPIKGIYPAIEPTAVRVGERWVVYYDNAVNGKIGALISKDFEKWADISDQLRFPEGVRHGSVLKISRKEFKRLIESISHEEIAMGN